MEDGPRFGSKDGPRLGLDDPQPPRSDALEASIRAREDRLSNFLRVLALGSWIAY